MDALNYKLYVSDDRCTLVRIWNDGSVEVSTRDNPHGIWGAPILMQEERP